MEFNQKCIGLVTVACTATQHAPPENAFLEGLFKLQVDDLFYLVIRLQVSGVALPVIIILHFGYHVSIQVACSDLWVVGKKILAVDLEPGHFFTIYGYLAIVTYLHPRQFFKQILYYGIRADLIGFSIKFNSIFFDNHWHPLALNGYFLQRFVT